MKSVFVINGFLDSGKTQFISYTIAQPYFQTKGTTLLIVCEEGEEEYDENLLKSTNTIMVTVEDESEISPEALVEFDKKYRPSRIIIEYNGMWNMKNFKLPFLWKLEQQITLADAGTFDLYFANMRSLFVEMVRKSELIIFNRCDGKNDKIPGYKRSVKMINQDAMIVFEDSQGEINATLEEELPYDVSKDYIELTDDTYGVWYIDMMDNHERYVGKTVKFLGNALRTPEMPKGIFVPGRQIMTCCVEDIEFRGYPCEYAEADKVLHKSWVNVEAKVAWKYFEGYGKEGPVLEVISVATAKTPKNEVITY